MPSRKKLGTHISHVFIIGLLTVSCGGGGGSSSPSTSVSPPPAPPPPPPSTQSDNTFAATGGVCDGTAGWLALSGDNLDDSAAIQTSLQEAANKGDTLTIPPGTYNIDDPDGISVTIQNQDFSIIATDVVFIAGPSVNSDLIDFDATSGSFTDRCGGDSLVDISWTGGELDISRAHLSGTVPQGTSVGATTTGDPVASTTDGLSIRGATGGTEPRAKAGAVSIKGVTIVSAPISTVNRTAYFEAPESAAAVDSVEDTWQNAGGDSGVFIVGAQSATVEDSSFFGTRDAAIYVSATPYDGLLGGNYTLINNRFYGSFDGISSKRGAQNIRMEGNTFVNVIRALSIESLGGPLRSTNGQTSERIVDPVVISNNVVNAAERAIQVESSRQVTLSDNIIRNLGARVARRNAPVRYDRYEGIVLEGVENATLSENSVSGVTGSRAASSDTVGLIVGRHAGIEPGSFPSSNVSIANSNAFSNLDADIEQ
jgi:hypothetical protein